MIFGSGAASAVLEQMSLFDYQNILFPLQLGDCLQKCVWWKWGSVLCYHLCPWFYDSQVTRWVQRLALRPHTGHGFKSICSPWVCRRATRAVRTVWALSDDPVQGVLLSPTSAVFTSMKNRISTRKDGLRFMFVDISNSTPHSSFRSPAFTRTQFQTHTNPQLVDQWKEIWCYAKDINIITFCRKEKMPGTRSVVLAWWWAAVFWVDFNEISTFIYEMYISVCFKQCDFLFSGVFYCKDVSHPRGTSSGSIRDLLQIWVL